jgi:DNA-binding MarR family transcriptional regulator
VIRQKEIKLVLDLLNNVDDMLSRANKIKSKEPHGPDLVSKLLSLASQLIEMAESISSLDRVSTVNTFDNLKFDGTTRAIIRRFQEPHINPSISRRLFESFYKIRRVRDRVFQEPDMFGEPAWDILLDLALANRDYRSVSVTSACIASCVPPTTALRWVSVLEAKGFVERTPDERDARRSYLMVTDKALGLLNKFSAEVVRHQLV